MKRAATERQGVVIFEDVPIERDPDQHVDYLLHISGIPRDQPSHLIHVFLNDKNITTDMGAERSSHAAEYMTYNSPNPEGSEVKAFAGAPFAEEQGDYEIVIDISNAMAGHQDDDDEVVDILLTMVGLDGEPLQTQNIEFSKVSVVRRSQE